MGIQCAPVPAAGVDHVAVEAAAAVAAEECTIAVDVHQEERGDAAVEVPAAEVVAGGGVDVEICQEGDQVVPEELVVGDASVEVVPTEVTGEEEIVVCDDNQELFSEPPMCLDEEVIQVDEVVAVEQEPELALGEGGEAEPEKKKKKKKTAEGEEGGEEKEKKEKKKKSEADGEGGEGTEKKKKKKKKKVEEGGEGAENGEKKRKKKKKTAEGEEG